MNASPGRTLPDLQEEIGTWQMETFGGVDEPPRIIAMRKKLKEEHDELELALTAGDYRATAEVRDEAADLAIVLLGLCDRLGIDLEAAIVAKMAVNRTRRWSAAAPGDVAKRLRADGETA